MLGAWGHDEWLVRCHNECKFGVTTADHTAAKSMLRFAPACCASVAHLAAQRGVVSSGGLMLRAQARVRRPGCYLHGRLALRGCHARRRRDVMSSTERLQIFSTYLGRWRSMKRVRKSKRA